MDKSWSKIEKPGKVRWRIDGKYEHTLSGKAINTTNGKKDYNITTDKINDRFTFTIGHPEKEKNKGLYAYEMTYTANANAVYMVDGSYKGWITDPESEIWFDLEGITGDISILEIEPGIFDIYIESPDPILYAHSIGEFNCQDLNQTITVTNNLPGFLQIGQCPSDSLEDIFFYGLMLLFIIAIVIVNALIIKLPVVDVGAGLGMLFFSLPLFACSAIFGGIGILFGFGIIIYGFLNQ